MNPLWALIHQEELTMGFVPIPSWPVYFSCSFPPLLQSFQLLRKQLLKLTDGGVIWFTMLLWPANYGSIAAVTRAAEHFERKKPQRGLWGRQSGCRMEHTHSLINCTNYIISCIWFFIWGVHYSIVEGENVFSEDLMWVLRQWDSLC